MVVLGLADCIISTMRMLKVFTYSELQDHLRYIPDSKLKSDCIQSILDNMQIRQVFEYYICE